MIHPIGCSARVRAAQRLDHIPDTTLEVACPEHDVSAGVPCPPAPRIRLMRGQVVVREVEAAPAGALWTPAPGARQVKTHTGEVLAMGAPARLTEHPDSPEVPHGFVVGDLVQFHFGAMGTQEARTRAWVDGEPATWLTQAEIDAVWEP